MAVYQALELRDYARIDMRLRPDGRVAVIEANPNPWLASKAEFAMAARKSGRTYTQLIEEIVELALARYGGPESASARRPPRDLVIRPQPVAVDAVTLRSRRLVRSSGGGRPRTVRVRRVGKNRAKKWPIFAAFSLPGGPGLRLYFDALLVWRTPNLLTLLSGGHVTFQVGDKVIYPNHGLGVVQGIETKTILGTTCGFYHLRMVANETTVLVPVDNVDGVGLRRAISDEEIERLFSLLGDGKIDNHQNWKGRFKDNSDRMRTGSIYDVVEVLKSLTFLARSKNLSFREKRMLDRAKFLVVSEISEVSHEITAAIEEKVDRALERCFTVKNRSIARPRPPRPRPPTRVTARRTAKAS